MPGRVLRARRHTTSNYSHDELAKLTTSPGWRLETDGKTEHTGTLEDVAKGCA
jgi:hypothetical protein